MAHVCDICGKGRQFGVNKPFSQKRTRKVWQPNLQKQSIEIGGTRMQVKICTQCLRTLKKHAKLDAAAEEKTETKTA